MSTTGIEPGTVMQRLHDAEINSSITAFFDGLWLARLGDERNGWDASATVDSFADAEAWLDRVARRLYPDSPYVIGVEEFLRRLPASERADQSEAPGPSSI